MINENVDEIKNELKSIENIRTWSYLTRLISLLGIGTFFDAFDTVMIGSIIPALVIYLHLAITQAGNIAASVFIGEFVGALTFGWLSEKFGRKTAFIISIFEYGIFGIATGLSSTYASLYAFRLISGFGLGGEVLVATTLVSEWAKTKRRGLITLGYESVYLWGIFLTPLIAAGIYSIFGEALGWRILFFLLVIPMGAGVVSIFALWESPRWLLSKGKLDKARVVLNKMQKDAKSKGAETTVVDKEVVQEIDKADTTLKGTELKELFSKEYRRRTGFNWVIWFTAAVVAIGVLTWLPEEYVRVGHLPVTLSLELTASTSALGVAVGYFNVFFIERFGRKPMAMIGYSLSIVGLIFGIVEALVYHNVQWPVLAIVAFFSFGGMGAILSLLTYIYTAELFPTRIRAWANGTSNAVRTVGAIITIETIGYVLAAGPTPYIGMFHVFLIFTIVAVVGLVVTAIFGIETKQKLLETLSP